MTSRVKAIICDLDGCLANHEHRLHFVDPNFDEDATKEFDEVDRHGIPVDESKFRWFTSKGQKWKPDWDAFFDAMGEDSVNEWCLAILSSIDEGQSSDYTIIFSTDRPEKLRYKTETWLREKCRLFVGIVRLFMRPDYLPLIREDKINPITGEKTVFYPSLDYLKPDHRPSHEVKREIYESEIRDKYDVLFCIEDDPKCVEMYRSLGLVCLDVGKR